MKECVTSYGPTMDSRVQPIFARCEYYVLVELESMACESAPNPNASVPDDAGILSARTVIGKGASSVLTGRVGPKAQEVLDTAGIEIVKINGGTVREAVEAFKSTR